MRFRPWLVIVPVLLIATVVEGVPPEPDVDVTHRAGITTTTPVTVFVYSTQADLSADDQETALDVARDVLSTAFVKLVWANCVPGTCLTPTPGALKIRIVQSPGGSERDAHHLGQALINSQTGSGELPTVFIDRTRRLAGELGIDHRVLLGRTIAHELGHLLLATTTHGNAGLMREIWSRDELLGARRADWVFDPHDADAIRQRLARRGNGRSRGAS